MNYPNPHALSCPWHQQAEIYGAPNIKWCEETLCQWISEPANTWSNLGYLFVASYLIYIVFKRHYSSSLKHYGFIIFSLGATSFYYHLSNYYLSQVIDLIPNYLFLSWMLGMNLIRLGTLRISFLMPFYLAVSFLCTVLLHLMYIQGWLFQLLTPVVALLVFATEVLTIKQEKISRKWLIGGGLTFILAFIFSFLDKSRIWCDPQAHGWFSQGHALWHWTGALAIFFVFKHYEQLRK